MNTSREWTQLVQQVDQLIAVLRHERAEAARWRTRATELEGLRLTGNRDDKLELQAKDRELDRLRKERKKVQTVAENLLQEIEQMEQQVLQGEETVHG